MQLKATLSFVLITEESNTHTLDTKAFVYLYGCTAFSHKTEPSFSRGVAHLQGTPLFRSLHKA